MNIWDRITGKLSSTSSRVRHLDPHVRQSWSAAVPTEFGQDDEELREVQAELRQSTEQLQTIQEREQFLGIRIQQYRKALNEQRDHWRAEQDRLGRSNKVTKDEERSGDPEEGQSFMTAAEFLQAEALLQKRLEKWQADEDALASIIETHKVILASCERMRRTVLQLQEKEQRILQMRGDCVEFIETAAELEQSETGRMEEGENASDDESERNGSHRDPPDMAV
ncbi:hypothetical protein FisN_2Lh189 [Fistulifera solaris]|uniref:Uncharacterized protein n=1 Tax=Fistulifera solaris TaxID=1519565 RepID=A0A1Z5KF19_FISSO|nr:hypothetical protein FisN_2Lh189 [Fistulifera solaris]|eukprot:GAX24914.1 hypothetical protein FisN_2Lh189 [Fistulifera solaris]